MSDGREGGYIKLHRRIKSWPLWQHMTALQRMVVIEVLLDANWKLQDGWFGPIDRGELGHAEETIAREAKVSRKVVRQAITLLEAEGFLKRRKVGIESGSNRAGKGPAEGLKRGRKPSVITIQHYDKYQWSDEDEGQIKNHARASRGPAEGQPRAPREEGEEGEEGKDLAEEVSETGSFELPLERAAPPARDPGEAKTPKPKRPATDPRFAPLRAAFEGEFSLATGEHYRWQGAKDALALRSLIAVPVEEFRSKAKAGLRAIGYARCATVAALAAKWNDLTAAGANGTGPPAKPANPRAMVPTGTKWDEKPW